MLPTSMGACSPAYPPRQLPGLPRNSQGRALVGDPRDDVHTIISQLHLAGPLALPVDRRDIDRLSGDVTRFAVGIPNRPSLPWRTHPYFHAICAYAGGFRTGHRTQLNIGDLLWFLPGKITYVKDMGIRMWPVSYAPGDGHHPCHIRIPCSPEGRTGNDG
jgi:hypothetical protein